MRIASDGLPFIMAPAIAAAAAAAMGSPGVAAALALLAATIAVFFRDPERCSDAPEPAAVSPADGSVLAAVVDEHGRAFIAIFLSLLDVHVARTPVGGRLVQCRRVAGGYAAAFREEAARNARVELRIETPHGLVDVALMAGLVARRVLPWVDAPRDLHRGERIAIIRFGSRAEIRLPRGYVPRVAPGDRVRAGETVIASADSIEKESE